MSHVQLSVEEYINSFAIDNNDIQELLALNEMSPVEYDGSPGNNKCSPCDLIDFIDPKDCGVDKSDLDLYLPMVSSSKGDIVDDRHYHVFNDNTLGSFRQSIHDSAKVGLKSNNIPLSQSVGVTMPQKPKNPSHSIEIVHGLELTHKPRYKSDYFSQDGTCRPPRYVADEKGNHFVTLKVAPGIQGFIRIDWVTIPTEKKIRYSMPYKFQQSNESAAEPDCNPIYKRIEADSFGIMKVYLVLIKSKQDELKNIQSLPLFPPVQHVSERTNNNNSIQVPPLMPKQLIQNYNLNKSHLAFTFYSLSPDGKSYVPEWDTTIYSTVLTEISTDALKKRTTTCPECLYTFEISVDGADDIDHETKIKKRKKQL